MNEEVSWAYFRASGALWFINRILHAFGLVLVVEQDETTGEITRVYPARTKWRGFDRASEELGFQMLSAYLRVNATELEKEANAP